MSRNLKSRESDALKAYVTSIISTFNGDGLSECSTDFSKSADSLFIFALTVVGLAEL